MRARVAAVAVAVVVAAASCADGDDDTSGASGCDPTVATGESTVTVSAAGNDYEVLLYVPGHAGDSPALVLDLHALGSTARQQALLSEMRVLADEEGFVVANPQGLVVGSSLGGGTGVRSWELAEFDTDARDDVEMVRVLLDELSATACVDGGRVYAMGFSNGGLFASRLACDLADRVVATFSVAGITHHDGCAPTRPVAVGALHGTADETVTYDGSGSGLDDGTPASRAFFAQRIPDEVAQFADAMGCRDVSDDPVGEDTTLRTHGGCDDGVEVVLYTVEGGSHTWPGSRAAALLESRMGAGTDDVDTSVAAWRFMSAYRRAD